VSGAAAGPGPSRGSVRAGLVPAVRDRASGGEAHATAVRTMFGRIAPTYDVLNHVLSGGIDVAWRHRAVAALRSAPEGATLDLCAGTMDLTMLLDRARPRGRLVAADFSEEMLARGRRKVPRAEVVVADAQKLPFGDGEMAAVVCGFGVRNVADPLSALREVRRVLAKGGVFVTLEFFRPETAVTRALHRAYASVVLPVVGGVLSGDREAYAYLAESMKGFLSRSEYERALETAGFARVSSEDLTFGVASIVRAEAPS
jgi:ubiquinone/menaquinone biosynthesis methyltransferase